MTFLPYQLAWINDSSRLCLAEKSVRIGWTYADAFKNVLKRLDHPRRDYLFASKDQATAIEYVRTCRHFCELLAVTNSILTHGVESFRCPVFRDGRATGFTEEIKLGYLKFDNGSRILAFSSNPNALRAFGGDVGLDEFAFHANQEALYASASGRVTWGFDLAIWSSHHGADTYFYQLTRTVAAQSKSGARINPLSPNGGEGQPVHHSLGEGGGEGASPLLNPNPPSVSSVPQRCSIPSWSFHRITLLQAVDQGLAEKINSGGAAHFSRSQFIADCQTRSRLPEIYSQEYLCNPCASTETAIPWSSLQLCQRSYDIERLHLDDQQLAQLFNPFHPNTAQHRTCQIEDHLRKSFPALFEEERGNYFLGFDVAASGRGSLSVIYVDQVVDARAQLVALLTVRTDDWHYLKTVLFCLLRRLKYLRACGDETGLGRQICWEASRQFPCAFIAVNFSAEKSRLGFNLMNQLASGEKIIPAAHPDIAADYFALRKHFSGGRWHFTETANPENPHSHCDLAWAGALASHARSAPFTGVQAFVF